jgi:hypothetical protein
MKRFVTLRRLLALLVLASSPGVAAIRYVEITGATAGSENACPAWVIEANQDDCSYNASNPSGLGGAQWIGPVFSAGYYGPGLAPAVFTNTPPPAPVIAPAPDLPLGGKSGIPIARGFIRIDDKDTPGVGTDDVITGTIEFGPFERNVATGATTRVIERFDRIIHRLLPGQGGASTVSSAAPNGDGGFDYIIGSSGGVATVPSLLSGLSDGFPSETASQSSPDAGDLAYWSAPAGNGIARFEGSNAIAGTRTGATVWGYSCDAGGGPGSCPTRTASNWEADLYARFGNVLIQLSTDGSGGITTASAVLVNELDLSASLAATDSWQATTLSFDGSVSQLPAAFDDRAIFVNELDISIGISVLGNDNPGVEPVTVTLLTPPAHGTVDLIGTPPTTFEYRPSGDPTAFEGEDTFTYEVADANGETATGTVQVLRTDAVFCLEDLAQSVQNQVTTLDILANDGGYDLPPVEVKIVSAPSAGTAVINPDRTLTFTPPPDEGGFFSIQYQLSDGTQEPVTCPVGIQVEADPVAVDDNAPVKIDTTTDIQILGNDTGITDVPLTVEITLPPVNGTAAVIVAGTPGTLPVVRYTPATGFVGSDTLRYRITDVNNDVSNEATVAINVIGPPDSNPPACTNDLVNAERDVPTVIDVLANDTGLEVQPVAVTITQGPASGSVVVTPGADTITYTPPPDTGGVVTFRYQASEAINPAVECSVTVLVNELPVAADDEFEFQAGAATALTVTNNDTGLTDAPLNIEIVQPPAHGTTEILVSPASGFPFIGYTPDAGYKGPDSLQYRILDCASIEDVDAQGFCTNTRDASNVATVTITITSVPEATDDGDPYPFPYRTARDFPITVDVLANDFGLADQPITVRIATDQNGNPLVLNGTAVVNPDNTVTFTPAPGFVGRSPTPGEIPFSNASGRFEVGERVDVRNEAGGLVYFSFVFEVLPDRLRVQDVGPLLTSVPPVGGALTGAVSGATAVVSSGYVPPCQIGCASATGGAGFRYEIIDGDGEADEIFGSDNDSEGIVLIDVFPGPVTDTGGSAYGVEMLALLGGAGVLRRRPRRRR